jgi:hypothetical protein
MPSFVDIEITGDDRPVNALLNRVLYTISPIGLEVFMDEMVEPWIKTRARDRFMDEGDDVSGAWAPLKPSTVLMRSQMGYGGDGPINKRTGELERYITDSDAKLTELGSGINFVYPGNKASGELADKVITAQVGKAFPNTVPRPVLGLNETDLEYVLTSISHFIQDI